MLHLLQTGQVGLHLGGDATDASFASVVLLLHCDGSNASTTVPDSSLSAHTTAATGDAQLQTSGALVGSASLALDGSVGDALRVDLGVSDWQFGAGNFTVEMTVRFAALTSADRGLVTFWDSAGSNRSWFFGVNNANKLVFYWSTDGSSVAGSVVGATTLTTGVTYKVAVTRVGSTAYVFLDGTVDNSGAIGTDTLRAGTAAMWIGYSGEAHLINACLMDEIRITKGVGRYSSSYTPDASAFPDS